MSIQAINVRNQFRAKIVGIVEDEVLTGLDIDTPIGIVSSVITTRSVKDLGLKIGSEVVALI